MTDPLLEIVDLKKYFNSPKGKVKAVDGVDLNILKGETLGLVGESGCGKSTLVRATLRLIEPTDGKVFLRGENVLAFSRKRLVEARGQMGMVFQDPHSSLNPRMTVAEILRRPLKIHNLVQGKGQIYNRTVELLETMGLSAEHMIRYPHELSGGQKQRVGVARALAVEPRILLLDEPTSALDVSVQTKILKLLRNTMERLDLTYVFISHDINLIRTISDRIAVMYLGKIVEIGEVDEVFADPLHPYTQGLFKSVPRPDPEHNIRKPPLTGEVPSPIDPPAGCNFAPRCPQKIQQCEKEEPNLKSMGKDREVACWVATEKNV
ncbi:ABC transporter ATP-binding protein [Candidatus Bipolaricaulota bacterium]|nr:ABC transporter ATP-binding protein [Candidatus Bipolaricaulota bacterium]